MLYSCAMIILFFYYSLIWPLFLYYNIFIVIGLLDND